MSLVNMRPRGGPAFKLTDLFKAGQQGLLWLPESHRPALLGTAGAAPTLYQDSAGSTVGAISQPVGLLHDVRSTSRRNHIRYSQDFANPAWLNVGATISQAPSIVAPDGSNTAASFVGADSALIMPGHSSKYNLPRLVAGQAVTLSIYSKANTRNSLRLWLDGSGNVDGVTIPGGAIFALNGNGSGSASVIEGGATASASITSVGSDGWYRCSLTVTPAVSGFVSPYIRLADSGSGAGDSTKGLYIWGSQFEVGAVATEYQRIDAVNHALQTTSTARPLLKDASGLYLELDGADDNIRAAFSAGTLPANADVYYVMRRTSAKATLAIDVSAGGRVFGIAGPTGDSSAAFAGCGSPSVTVQGVPVAVSPIGDGAGGSAVTRGGLLAATPSNTDLIVEVRGANLSAWEEWATVGPQWSAFAFAGRIYAVLICPAQTDSNRAKIRKALAKQFGIGGVV